jgi:hypothetical protein
MPCIVEMVEGLDMGLFDLSTNNCESETYSSEGVISISKTKTHEYVPSKVYMAYLTA